MGWAFLILGVRNPFRSESVVRTSCWGPLRMSDGSPNVLILAGRLMIHDAEALRARLLRLEDRRIGVSIIGLSAPESQRWLSPPFSGAEQPKFVACPALGNRWRQPWAIRELTSEYGPPRPDLIHALGFEMAGAALALAERWRTPYLLELDEFLPAGAKLRLSRNWCRGLIASGNDLADDLVVTLGLPRQSITVIRPGFVAEIGPMSEEAAPPSPSATRLAVVGSASRLAPGSGLATFLQAARLVLDSGRDAEFLIAGRGPSEGPLRQLAETLGVSDRVTFADGDPEAPPFWQVLDLFCLTTLTPTTGFALSLAMAHGVPSIASEVRGLDGLLDDGQAGLLIPPSDPETLAAAINELLGDPERSRLLGLSGRARINALADPDREADELANLYQRAIASSTSLVDRRRSLRADRRSAFS